jgi:hypothetical protein
MVQKSDEIVSFRWIRDNMWFLTLVVTVSGGGFALTAQVADLAQAQDRTSHAIEAHAAKPDHDGAAVKAAITETQISDIQRRLGALETGQQRIADQTGEVLSELRMMRQTARR